jgi:hypothetical protein
VYPDDASYPVITYQLIVMGLVWWGIRYLN